MVLESTYLWQLYEKPKLLIPVKTVKINLFGYHYNEVTATHVCVLYNSKER